MAYASASNVYAFSKNLAGGQKRFSDETDPTLTEIEWHLTSGCGVIHTALTSNGWSVPAASGTALYDQLSNLNAMYAAAMAEMSRINIVIGPGERSRAQMWLSEFRSQLTNLVESDLGDIGGEVATNDGEIFVGGISETSKDSYYEDSDRVKSRFKRNQFKFSDSNYPE